MPGKPLVSPDNVLTLLQHRDKKNIKVATDDAVKDKKNIKVDIEVETLLSKKDFKDSHNEYLAFRKADKKQSLINTDLLKSEASAAAINIPNAEPASDAGPITLKDAEPVNLKAAEPSNIKDSEPINLKIAPEEAGPKEVAAPREEKSAPISAFDKVDSAPIPAINEVKSASIPAIDKKEAVNTVETAGKENQNEPLATAPINIPKAKPAPETETITLKIPLEEAAPKQDAASEQVKSASIPAAQAKEGGNAGEKQSNENQNDPAATPVVNTPGSQSEIEEETTNIAFVPEVAAATAAEAKSAAAPKTEAETIVIGNSVEEGNKENQNEYITGKKSYKRDASLGGESARPEAAAPEINITAVTPEKDEDTNKLKVAREENADKKQKTITGSGAEQNVNETPEKKEPKEKKELNLVVKKAPQGQSGQVSSEGGENSITSGTNSITGGTNSVANGDTSDIGGLLGSGKEFTPDSFDSFDNLDSSAI